MSQLNDLTKNTFQGLSLDRFLGKQVMDATDGSLNPFQGIQPYQSSNDSMVYNNPMNSFNQPATSIAAGTLISDLTVRTSAGGQIIPGSTFQNGRVELNRGFTDSAGTYFPYDNLTAFGPENEAEITISYLGIQFNSVLPGLYPTLSYVVGTNSYSQPISYGTGRVLANGTPTSNFPTGWVCTRTGTGNYNIKPDSAFIDDTYGVLLTPVNGASTTMTIKDTTVNDFNILSFKSGGAAVDTEFSFTIFTTTD